MAHNVLKHDEEVMQRQMIAVQHAAIAERLLYQLLHDQFRNVHQVAALDDHRVSRCERRKQL